MKETYLERYRAGRGLGADAGEGGARKKSKSDAAE